MRIKLSFVWAVSIVSFAFVAAAAVAPEIRQSEAVSCLAAMAGTEIAVHPVTGAVRHARFQPGSVVTDGSDVAEKTELFLIRHGFAFGVDAPASSLQKVRERVDRLHHTHLVFDQMHRGVPVFGARLALHFDPSGELVAVGSSAMPDVRVDRITPDIGADAADRQAVRLVAKLHGADPSALEIDSTELVVFNDGAIWGRPGEDNLAWQIEVSNDSTIRETLFIDAHDGRLIERIDGIEEIHRTVYENNTGNLVWNEGDPLPYSGSGPSRDVDINTLIEASNETYKLFANISGGTFLSWNGSDGPMRMYYARNGMSCPNAYFNGSTTSFCEGVASDDIVAHEWAHGYTQETHGLVYAWQSGALNESYSDIFGEIVDLLYDSGNDDPSTVREPGVCSAATGNDDVEFLIQEPASIAGLYDVRSARFNPAPPWEVSGMVEPADDGVGNGNDACDDLVDFTPGKIALITMAGCAERFKTPVSNAEAAGAIGVIMVNPLNDSLVTMSGDGMLSIPSVFLGKSDGQLIRDAIEEGVAVRMSSGSDGSRRWLIGEDSPGFGGAIRDMWRPECLTDPGSVFSSRYYCGSGDNGGVHINSGIPNHAFAMLVDGGVAANGIEVPAIGMTRATHIYWRAMSVYQLPLSDFRDHAEILLTSCRDLLGAPLPDLVTGAPAPEVITEAHCAAVEQAVLATEMNEWPSQCNFATILDPDDPGLPGQLTVFSESFDTSPGDWTLSNAGVYAEYEPRDWVWTESVPDGGDGGAFYAIDSPVIGDCHAGNDDQSGVMHLDSPSIVLPLGAEPYLLFDHYVATEYEFDGGNVKISVNGGEFQLIPGTDFTFNPYNMVLRTAQDGNPNPLAGEEAFSGTDANTTRGSWGQSQIRLDSVAHAGDEIVLRFDFGVDGCSGQDGWYVDNVSVVMNPRERQGGSRVTP